MNYDYLWKTLEELIIELRRKGVSVPQEVVDDLKSAKTLISVYKVNPTSADTVTRIEDYVGKVESYLFYLAEANLGEDYAEECLRRIGEARGRGLEPGAAQASRFIPGLPRGEHWVRINTRDTIEQKELEELATGLELSLKAQENDYILIHGDREKIKALLRRVADETRRKGVEG